MKDATDKIPPRPTRSEPAPRSLQEACARIAELERSNESLRHERDRYRSFVDNANDMVFELTSEGFFAFISPNCEEMLGYDARSVIGRHFDFLTHPDDTPRCRALLDKTLLSGAKYGSIEYRARHRNGEWRWFLSSASSIPSAEGHARSFLGIARDITARKLTEREREATLEFLTLVQECTETSDLIHQAIAFFQQQSGCDAAGIRLRDGEDYPYYETCGFPPGFVQKENALCRRDESGQPILDSGGSPITECLCGNVICGRFDPSKPFFTAHGSFWTNCTSELLASTTEAERQSCTRNRCNVEGFESVALLPLRIGGVRLGLLQLNSRSPGAFSAQAIALWERLSGYLAMALSHSHTQEALRMGEARLRALGDNIPGGALYQLLSTPGGRTRYTHMSAGVEKIFGLSSERVLADPEAFWDLIVDEDRKRIDAEQERSTREMSVFDCEFRQRTSSGEIKWFHARSTPRTLEDGSIVWDGVVADINERKRTEEALRDSEMRFRSLIESAPDAIFVQSEGRFAYLNPSMLALLGSSRAEELLDTDIFTRIDPEYHNDVILRIKCQNESGGRAPLMDQHYLRLDGTRVPVETTAVPIRFLNRDAHLVFVRDITERKRAEAERERLIAAIEQSSEVVVITDTTPAILYVNPAFEHVTGYTRAEALGQNPHVLKSGRQDAAFYAALWQTLTSGETWRGRFTNKRKDGTFYTEEASISPVRNAAGLTVNYVAVKRDITEHLRLETELRQAQKMESVGRLAGGVAHDFNNMLSVILGSAELALSAVAPDQPFYADLEEIRKAAERSADLTRQLLTFACKQAVSPKVLVLNDAVATTLKMMRRLIGENVDLTWRPCALDTTVRIDPSQLDQILANLAVNARDAIAGVGHLAIETGSATLTPSDCAGHKDGRPGDYVTLTVSDTGCGMDADTLEHVFEPFFTTKSVGEGTGLGLATVYGIVQQNGGFITVHSELGKGTAFSVFLPRQSGAAELPQKAAAEELASAKHETILLVEDEASILKLGKRTLERLGYRVLTASKPSEAILWSDQQAGAIDLLISDVVMPEMNGWDLAKKIAARFPNIKLLFMSGYTSSAITQHDMLSSGAEFIQKPFTLRALGAKVGAILNG